MNNTQKFLLVGGITYGLMGLGRAICSAPMFFAILFLLFDLLMWIGDGDTYNSVGFIIGSIELFAVVLGIGLAVSGNFIGGLWLFVFLSCVASFIEEKHHDPINHPSWNDVNMPKIEAAAAIAKAEDEAKESRNDGWHTRPSTVAPKQTAPIVTTPAPKPYVLNSWDNDPTPTVRPEPQITRPVVTPTPTVVTSVTTSTPVTTTTHSSALGHFVERLISIGGILAAVGGVIFVGAWLCTLYRKSQAAKFARAYLN